MKSGAYWTSSAGMRLGSCSFVWAGNGTHAHSEPIVHPRNEHYPDRRSGLGRFNGGVCLATARHDTESRAGSRGDTHTRCATRARVVLWQGVPGQSHGQRRTLRHERHGCGAPQLPIGDPRPSDESRERPVAGAADPRSRAWARAACRGGNHRRLPGRSACAGVRQGRSRTRPDRSAQLGAMIGVTRATAAGRPAHSRERARRTRTHARV